ncbi:hypothetical protein HMPREF1141_0438 [Clostridium sp. MSTE9]|nr:hypothetical protein HMPREF1141_0438 [Clostridium sp. MSTE9]
MSSMVAKDLIGVYCHQYSTDRSPGQIDRSFSKRSDENQETGLKSV